MGYSGLTIFNGDLPSDVVYSIMKKIKIKEREGVWIEPKKGSIQHLLSANQFELLDMCSKKGKGNEKYIPILVLGATMINYGASISDKLMSALIEACENDPWSFGKVERAVYLDDFKKILASYDNKTPTSESRNRASEYGISHEDLMLGRFSSKVAKMAFDCLKERLKKKAWFIDLSYIFSENGHALLLNMKFNKIRTPKLSLTYFDELFDVPIFLTGKEPEKPSPKAAKKGKKKIKNNEKEQERSPA